MKQGRRLLIGDDDAKMCKLVRRVAEPYGFEVIEASNGTQIKALALELRPDLIVLDMKFPDDDGRDVLAQLKAEPRTAGIPVLVWSGGDPALTRSVALALGAEEFVEKETAQSLIARINRFMLRLEGQ